MKKISIACAIAFCAFAGYAEPGQSKPGVPEKPAPAAPAASEASEDAKIAKTAVAFCNAMIRDGNIDAAKKMMSSQAAALFDAVVAMGGEDAMKKIREEAKANAKKVAKFTAGKVTITGDKAKVVVTGEVDGETNDETIDLAKEDGQWKIAINKEDMAK